MKSMGAPQGAWPRHTPIHFITPNLIRRPKVAQAEYIIYAYDSYAGDDLGKNHWQRILNSNDVEKACRHAEVLFAAQQYQKIEIKKKIFDEKKGRYICSTFKNFEHKPKNNYFILAAIFFLALSSVGLFTLSML